MKLSDIHHVLCGVRKERELAQKDIAAALNVEQATVSMYETGKRGIPLDLLDEWLRLLEIEVKITPKGHKPVKKEKDTQSDLRKFDSLKRRRNYLIAEMRAMLAEKMMGLPEFGQTDEESGEGRFWPYSFCADPAIGLIETRYDHPEQKFIAVEYTSEEVNVYKFLTAHEVSDGESDHEWLKVNRIYFSEDDFLTYSSIWDQESLDMRRVTILRKNKAMPDGVEIIDVEGFPVRSLLEMQENYLRFLNTYEEIQGAEAYLTMENELDVVMDALSDMLMNNRLENGAANPEFIYWTDTDKEAVEVPLWSPERSWFWVEEGLTWKEIMNDHVEIQVTGESVVDHEQYHTLRDEKGNRVIGLVSPDDRAAVFKINPAKPDVIYRVAADLDELNEEERKEYRRILEGTKLLAEVREKE